MHYLNRNNFNRFRQHIKILYNSFYKAIELLRI